MPFESSLVSTKSKGNVIFPPLLCLTLSNPKRKSEYASTFSPKHHLIYPGNKLSPTFLYQSSRNFDSKGPRESRLPGFVARRNTGALHDYSFVHTRAFYRPLNEPRQYFTLGIDWVSEKPLQKNNPFS